MENEIAYLKTEEGLEFKLTSDKLFITGATGTEAFALRSINGIGVLDLVEKYNLDLVAFNARLSVTKASGGLLIFFGVIFLLPTLLWGWTFTLILSLPLIAIGIYILSKIDSNQPPQLESCVRIMLNGMNRDFSFDKRKTSSTDVANFVARVEDTLTAFHKNQ